MSGSNPRGRPRKIRALVSTKIGGQPGIGFEDRIKPLAIEEAYRLITIREGDRTERIPVIRAILRKVAVAAANGNIRAQQNYLNLLIGAEADRRVARSSTPILTCRIAALARYPRNSRALLWNPAGASFEDAWCALDAPDGVLAVIGGTDVFGLFLEIGYDSFHLSRAKNVRLPDGRRLFPEVRHEVTPEEMLC